MVLANFAPAKALPEGMSAQHGEGDIEKEENSGIPEEHAADGKLRLRNEDGFHLLWGKLLVRRQIMEGQNPLNYDQAHKTEKDKQDEVWPRPGDL